MVLIAVLCDVFNEVIVQSTNYIDMAPLIAFIIGAGKNIGAATASALKGKGYQVAVGSRKPVIDEIKKNGYFPVAVDASNAESVQAAFAQVNKELGAPSVVIFNGEYSL